MELYWYIIIGGILLLVGIVASICFSKIRKNKKSERGSGK